jgi:DNA polymerase-3 subunit epsilon
MLAWLNGLLLRRQKRKLKEPGFEFLFNEEVPGSYVCFDCETTGLDPKKDKIVSLSAIKIQGNQVLTSQSLNLLIEQEGLIAAESIVVHRIRNIDVVEKESSSARLMTEAQAIKEFLEFIKGSTLVGYYLEFDIAMVNQVIKPWLGVNLPNRQVEVSALYYDQMVRLAKRSGQQGLQQPNIDLTFDKILHKLKLPNLGQHDAFSDALMTALIFVKLQQDRN